MDINNKTLLTKHVDKSPHERKKAVECVGDLRLIRIKIQDLPTDTVAQWVEHRRDNPWTWVCIPASVRFFIFFVAFFLSLLPWLSVGGSNFDMDLQNSTMLIQKKTDKKLLYIYIFEYRSVMNIPIGGWLCVL